MEWPERELRVGRVPARRLCVVPRGHVALRGIQILRDRRERQLVGGPRRRRPALPIPLAGREVGKVVVDAGGADRIVPGHLVCDVLVVDVEPVERRVQLDHRVLEVRGVLHQVGTVHPEKRRRAVGLVEEGGALAHVGDRLPVHGRERLHDAVHRAQRRRRHEHVAGDRRRRTDHEQRVVQQVGRRRRQLRRVRERGRVRRGEAAEARLRDPRVGALVHREALALVEIVPGRRRRRPAARLAQRRRDDVDEIAARARRAEREVAAAPEQH